MTVDPAVLHRALELVRARQQSICGKLLKAQDNRSVESLACDEQAWTALEALALEKLDKPVDAEAAEMARLLEAMAAKGFSVTLDSGAEAGVWWCEWNVQGHFYQAKALSMYEAVKQCWEWGQA